jgi:hypothetical protein
LYNTLSSSFVLVVFRLFVFVFFRACSGAFMMYDIESVSQIPGQTALSKAGILRKETSVGLSDNRETK